MDIEPSIEQFILKNRCPENLAYEVGALLVSTSTATLSILQLHFLARGARHDLVATEAVASFRSFRACSLRR
jgi:hypothetical protein